MDDEVAKFECSILNFAGAGGKQQQGRKASTSSTSLTPSLIDSNHTSTFDVIRALEELSKREKNIKNTYYDVRTFSSKHSYSQNLNILTTSL